MFRCRTWCHATGNLSRKITMHTNMCQRPNSPIARWMGSVGAVVAASLSAASSASTTGLAGQLSTKTYL